MQPQRVLILQGATCRCHLIANFTPFSRYSLANFSMSKNCFYFPLQTSYSNALPSIVQILWLLYPAKILTPTFVDLHTIYSSVYHYQSMFAVSISI